MIGVTGQRIYKLSLGQNRILHPSITNANKRAFDTEKKEVSGRGITSRREKEKIQLPVHGADGVAAI